MRYNVFCLFSIADESRESDTVVVEYAGGHGGNHHACNNGSDAVPVLDRHSVANDYVEQHRRVGAVDRHLARQCGSERGNERADDVSAAAAEYNHHGRQFRAALERNVEHREIYHGEYTNKTFSVSPHPCGYDIGESSLTIEGSFEKIQGKQTIVYKHRLNDAFVV